MVEDLFTKMVSDLGYCFYNEDRSDESGVRTISKRSD